MSAEQGNNTNKARKVNEEYLRRLKHEKYRYYEPSGIGEEFIDAYACGDYFIVLFSAANGVGKTATGANILAHQFWNTGENEFFNGKLFKDFPYKKQGRIVSDPTNVSKNIVPELKSWFPKGRYTTSKGGKHYESLWETDTGWGFDIMTYEQDPREFEGVTLGWAWFDEPPPENIFKAMVSRMRKGGIIFITATPINADSAYMYDAFARGTYEMEIEDVNGNIVKYERKVKYLTADIESVCKEHGVRGHLKHDDIMRMIAEYDPDERQARIHGKFQHLIGMVFKGWDTNVHVIEPFDVNPRDFSVVQFLDPHPRVEDAMLWVAVDKYGTKYVVDELFHNPKDTADLAYRIKQKDSQFRVLFRRADPSLFLVNQHENEGKSLAEKLDEHGLHYEPASKQRAMADRRIKDALAFRKAADRVIKAPELYVFSSCKRTIWEIEHYRWDNWVGKAADRRTPKPKPVDKDDHMIENLGRALLAEPVFEPMVEHNSYRDAEVISDDDLDPYE